MASPVSIDPLQNPVLQALLHQRANGNAEEQSNLLLASQLNYEDNPMAVLENGRLLWGSEVHAADSAGLKQHAVTHIFNVAGTFSAKFHDQCVYEEVTMADEPTATLPLQHCVDVLRRALEGDPSHRMLVHCIEGRSRSGAVILAYLMQQHRWTLQHAMQQVASQRRAQPNSGFMKQLLSWEELVLKQ
jgi:hypothetical protein